MLLVELWYGNKFTAKFKNLIGRSLSTKMLPCLLGVVNQFFHHLLPKKGPVLREAIGHVNQVHMKPFPVKSP